MATLTPIASLAATMQSAPRHTTLAGGTIADPEETVLLRTFASGMKQIEQELSKSTPAAEAPSAELIPWEPHWISP